MDHPVGPDGDGVRCSYSRVQLFQRSKIQAGEQRNQGDLFKWKTDAGDDHKVAEGKQSFGRSPGGNLAEGIHTDDERERAGKPLAQCLDRLDAVGAPGSRKFHITQRKRGIVADGEANHLGAVTGVGKMRALFMGRVGRRNEENPIESKLPLYLLCDIEVPVVDRIKRSAEEANPVLWCNVARQSPSDGVLQINRPS